MVRMSLNVPPTLLAKAAHGEVNDAEFVACVRDSLPYAWKVVDQLATELSAGETDFAEHTAPPPGDIEQGQLFRALASDAIRGGLQRHFGVTLAFQNCHRVAAFRSIGVNGPRYQEFVSPAGQLRNQIPELRNC